MSATAPTAKRAKTTYIAPALTTYGSALKLTAAGTGQSNEGATTDPLKKP